MKKVLAFLVLFLSLALSAYSQIDPNGLTYYKQLGKTEVEATSMFRSYNIGYEYVTIKKKEYISVDNGVEYLYSKNGIISSYIIHGTDMEHGKAISEHIDKHLSPQLLSYYDNMPVFYVGVQNGYYIYLTLLVEDNKYVYFFYISDEKPN